MRLAKPNPGPSQRLQFTLQTLLVLPVFVAALGAIGVWFGWLVACILAMIPVGFFLGRFGTPALNTAGVVAGVGLLVAWMVSPFILVSRGPTRRDSCMNNLSQIGKALLHYEAVHGSFPPPYTTDDNGQALVSWRALILIELGRRDLYERCHIDRRWDALENAELNDQVLREFCCPSDPKLVGHTNYVAVVGPGTVWSADEPVSLSDLDDPGRTILLVEVADSGIDWLEPRDLPLKDALRGINARPGPTISSGHPGCVVALFADGHIEVLHESISLSELRDLLTFEL